MNHVSEDFEKESEEKELRMILQYIGRRVVGNVLITISQSNIFLTMHLLAVFHQNCQAAFGR